MSDTKVRIRLVSFAVIVFAFLIIVRLYLLQIAEGQEFRDRANHQYLQPSEGVYDRGTIYFQDKSNSLIAAAALKTGYILAINPALISDPEKTYAAINTLLPIDHDSFIQKATTPDSSYQQIEDKVDPVISDKITALKLSGVDLYEERWRYYPGTTLAAHVLGFVGYDGTTTDGRYGLEKQYDSTLERMNDDVYVNLFAQIFSGLHNSIADNGTAEGDIVTSIDPNVQTYLEGQLQGVEDQYHSQISGGIIINPQTGAIYAMAANPTFDPNTYGSAKDIGVFTNPLVQNVYEMGSIFKSFTMAAGIDAGLVTATTTYNDVGHVQYNNQTVWNYDLRGRGPDTTMQTVLDDSLNTGAAFVEQKLGNTRFAGYINKFGFNEPTNVDLPNEAHNLTSTLTAAQDINYVTASFGQGIAVTPISTIRALSALVNGGMLVTPHVVTQINYNVGFSRTLSYPIGPRVIASSTSRAISAMLTNVVDSTLFPVYSTPAVYAKLDKYSIAAKTGTAQIPAPGGGYLPDQYLNSFFGFFPSTNPQYLIFLYTYKPVGVEFASKSLTPYFINITDYLINYYNVPPDR